MGLVRPVLHPSVGHQRRVAKLSGPTATVFLSRYTVALHSVALRFPGCGGGVRRIALHPLSKGPVAPTVSVPKGVSHFKLALGRCRSTGGCRSYTVACRATAGHSVAKMGREMYHEWGGFRNLFLGGGSYLEFSTPLCCSLRSVDSYQRHHYGLHCSCFPCDEDVSA